MEASKLKPFSVLVSPQEGRPRIVTAALPRLRAREVDEYRLSAIRGLAALGVLAVAAVLFVSVIPQLWSHGKYAYAASKTAATPSAGRGGLGPRGGSSSSPEPPLGLHVNIALGQKVQVSPPDGQSGCSSARALVDGLSLGLEGACDTQLVLAGGAAALVPLGLRGVVAPVAPRLVEVVAAVAQCERFLTDKKKMQPCEGPLNAISATAPLVLELLAAAGGEPIATARFAAPQPVFRWRPPPGAAGATLLSIRLDSPSAPLHLAEARVYGALPAGAPCASGVCGDRGSCVAAKAPAGAAAGAAAGPLREVRCDCEPDWFGPSCDHHIYTAASYLPPNGTVGAHGPGGWGSASEWEGVGELIQQVQTESCERGLKRASQHQLLPGPRGAGAGLASSLFYLLGDHTAAFEASEPYLFTGRLNYAMNQHCADLGLDGALECYFKPLASEECEAAGYSKQRGKYALPKGNKEGQPDCMLGSKCLNVSDLYRVPDAYARRGLFWWRAAQMAQLTRLNERAEALLGLGALAKELRLDLPTVGLHVRHGDACHTTRRAGRCEGLERYLPALEQLRDAYGVQRVFVATDDPEVIADTKRFPAFQWLFVPQDLGALVAGAETKIEHRLKADAAAAHGIMLSALTDTFLLAQCDYMVLSLTSTMSRMALLLGAARQGKLPPFVSTDAPYCPHWRMCCDLNEHGTSTPC